MAREQKCIVLNCPSTSVHLRGLCRSCYVFASNLIALGITTWDGLESAGAVLHTTGKGHYPRRPDRLVWFSRICENDPDVLWLNIQKARLEKRSSARKEQE